MVAASTTDKTAFVENLKNVLKVHIASKSGRRVFMKKTSSSKLNLEGAEGLLAYIASVEGEHASFSVDVIFSGLLEKIMVLKKDLQAEGSTNLLPAIDTLLIENGYDLTFADSAVLKLNDKLTEATANSALQEKQYIIPESKDDKALHRVAVLLDTNRTFNTGGVMLEGNMAKVIEGYGVAQNIPPEKLDAVAESFLEDLEKTHPGLSYFLTQGAKDVPGTKFLLAFDIKKILPEAEIGYTIDIGKNDEKSFLMTERYTIAQIRDIEDPENPRPLADPVVVDHTFRATYSEDRKSLSFKTVPPLKIHLASEPKAGVTSEQDASQESAKSPGIR